MKVADLDPTECRRLLDAHAAAGGSGRVVLMGRVLPQVHPILYLLDGGEAVLPVDPDVLTARDHDGVLGLHVDDLGPATLAGWSVLAVGAAYPITDQQRAADLARRRPDLWPHGNPAGVALPLQQLTGQRLRLRPRTYAACPNCAGQDSRLE